MGTQLVVQFRCHGSAPANPLDKRQPLPVAERPEAAKHFPTTLAHQLQVHVKRLAYDAPARRQTNSRSPVVQGDQAEMRRRLPAAHNQDTGAAQLALGGVAAGEQLSHQLGRVAHPGQIPPPAAPPLGRAARDARLPEAGCGPVTPPRQVGPHAGKHGPRPHGTHDALGAHVRPVRKRQPEAARGCVGGSGHNLDRDHRCLSDERTQLVAGGEVGAKVEEQLGAGERVRAGEARRARRLAVQVLHVPALGLPLVQRGPHPQRLEVVRARVQVLVRAAMRNLQSGEVARPLRHPRAVRVKHRHALQNRRPVEAPPQRLLDLSVRHGAAPGLGGDVRTLALIEQVGRVVHDPAQQRHGVRPRPNHRQAQRRRILARRRAHAGFQSQGRRILARRRAHAASQVHT
eukprot:scaffold3741_cov114-Isochrysis_galbana.AAC.6